MVILLHAAAGGAAYTLAFFLRFDSLAIPVRYQDLWQKTIVVAILIKMVTFTYFRLHRGVWRYASMNDLVQLVKAVTLGTLFLIVAVLFLHGHHFPRSIFINDWLLTLCFYGGLRFLRRFYHENLMTWLKHEKGRPTLIIGAGDTGELAIRGLRKEFGQNYRVIGFVDDNPGKHGSRIHDIPVLGALNAVPQLIRAHKISDIVIAINDPPKRELRAMVDACSSLAVSFHIMPTFQDLVSGRLVHQDIRNVQVEDLLGRDPIDLRREPVQHDISGKRVLITGAGGSIGSELARQVAAFAPEQLVLLDFSENALFEIDQELHVIHPLLSLVPVIADMKLADAVEDVFSSYRPQLVYHAAAYKHVPLMERFPVECVANNVFGTNIIAQAASRHKTEKLVLISTDKAVRPCSVMGASKRLAELLVTSRLSTHTCFIAVRFGNVLGSSGSVVPTFRRQIARGGPITVTHPEITRYFITIPEAVELVLHAGTIGKGGEVFVLDMGEPVKIVDLARNMIELSGLKVGEDIRIEFTGLRPGEKLHEELVACGEEVSPTTVPKLMVYNPSQERNWSVADLETELEPLATAIAAGDQEATQRILWQIIRRHDPDTPLATAHVAGVSCD